MTLRSGWMENSQSAEHPLRVQPKKNCDGEFHNGHEKRARTAPTNAHLPPNTPLNPKLTWDKMSDTQRDWEPAKEEAPILRSAATDKTTVLMPGFFNSTPTAAERSPEGPPAPS